VEYKLFLCESCENLISVKDNTESTFTCPVCGCINDRIRKDIFVGKLTAISPNVSCESDNDDDENEHFVPLTLADLDDEVYEAMIVLLQYGWVIKFEGSKTN